MTKVYGPLRRTYRRRAPGLLRGREHSAIVRAMKARGKGTIGRAMIEHLRGRERALEPLGWTGREAEWIALVCLHSGVFTRAQFCHYFNTQRMTALRFVKAFDRTTGGGRNRCNCLQRRRKDVPNFRQGDLPGAWS